MILLMEITGLLFFAGLTVYDFILKKKDWPFLFGAALFGIALELVGVHFWKAYTYSPSFLIQVNGVPVVIALCWGGILYSSKQVADTFRFNGKPAYWLFIALLTVIIDLSMDIIAIRVGMWTWPLSYSEQWFGVPYENILGWFFIPFAFSMFYDLLRNKVRNPFVMTPLIPVLSVIALQAFFLFLFLGQDLVYIIGRGGVTPEMAFPISYAVAVSAEGVIFKSALFFILFPAVLVYVLRNIAGTEKRPWTMAFPILYLFSFHLQFLFALFLTGLYRESPYFIGISLSMAALEFMLVEYRPKAPAA